MSKLSHSAHSLGSKFWKESSKALHTHAHAVHGHACFRRALHGFSGAHVVCGRRGCWCNSGTSRTTAASAALLGRQGSCSHSPTKSKLSETTSFGVRSQHQDLEVNLHAIRARQRKTAQDCRSVYKRAAVEVGVMLSKVPVPITRGSVTALSAPRTTGRTPPT